MMRKESYIRINKWLLPLSFLYGLAVRLRNFLFDKGMLRSSTFAVPVIAVGNISVGGTGKTPHVEYLVELLRDRFKVAVLSRGYKRKSRGYRLATAETTASEIGDEPSQMHYKYNNVYVAVDEQRADGIQRLLCDEATRDVQVIVLDDSYQHRYVKPTLNILLIDSHRMITDDRLLPAGRLREPPSGKLRADIVVLTKCCGDMTPSDCDDIKASLSLLPHQQLFFTTMVYGDLKSLFGDAVMPLSDIKNDTTVLVLTGIAEPRPLLSEVKKHANDVRTMTFADHHEFTSRDIETLNAAYFALPRGSIIITTEKDAARLATQNGLAEEVKARLFVLPIRVKFLFDEAQTFNEIVLAACR